MPNIAAVLKEEIRRLAKKEVQSHTTATKHAVAQYRRDIAKLKRLVREQQARIAFFAKQLPSCRNQPQAAEEPLAGLRYSARSVRAQRSRLGFSAEDYGKLVGVSGLTVYNWEHGKARPRKAQLAALIAVRGIGKREALEAAGGSRHPGGTQTPPLNNHWGTDRHPERSEGSLRPRQSFAEILRSAQNDATLRRAVPCPELRKSGRRP